MSTPAQAKTDKAASKAATPNAGAPDAAAAPKAAPSSAPPRKGGRKGLSMEKWLCLGGMAVSGGLLALFLADLFAKFPFGGLSAFVDILASIACAIVLFLSWDAYKDVR
jgi:hypothetical protein